MSPVRSLSGVSPAGNSLAGADGIEALTLARKEFFMTDTKQCPMDKLALVLCLGGVLVAAAVAMLGKSLNRDFVMIA